MAQRPDDDTIHLLRQVLEEVGANEAVVAGGTLFSMTIEFDNETRAVRTTLREPPIRTLRHLLDRLRQLDMLSSDIRLERVWPIIEGLPIGAGWRASLEDAKKAYRSAQEVGEIRVQQPDEAPVANPETDATWIRPREAFDIWAYGGVIHNDYAKEQKWARLGIGQGWVRQMAHDYTMMLLDQADFLLRLLRSLDEQ